MSITKMINLLMMIFLLFHPCNARSLGVLSKNEEKPNFARVSSTPSPTDVTPKPSSAEPSSSVKENGKDHHHYGVSVTWKVHQQKREDPPPEFNLDYLPARTHPPVHN
ncbi:unnamed protein product [Withania somnifera]